MGAKAQAILDEIKALPPAELRELWRDFARCVSQVLPAEPVELHGEPLTDDDLTEAARITFQTLDEEERRAQPR